MTQPPQNPNGRTTQGYCRVPESIMKANRGELTDIKMNVRGELPEDLQGHVFIVAPVGSVNSGGLPYPDGDSFWNVQLLQTPRFISCAVLT